MSDVLKHFGVKGMKWGVIRERKVSSSKDSKSQNENKVVKRVKEEVESLKRERSWKTAVEDINKMSTKDIGKMSTRIQLENDLKRLSSNKSISSPKDRQDYRLRGKMSDHEINRKVVRLRAKETLQRNISQASSSQRETGKTIIRAAAPIVLNKVLGLKISPKDIDGLFVKKNLNDEVRRVTDNYYNRKK